MAVTACLKVWNVSYGARCVEVAAENASRAVEITLAHLGVEPVSGGTLAGLRVSKVDRTIVVEVGE
jgi:hypothetical protein